MSLYHKAACCWGRPPQGSEVQDRLGDMVLFWEGFGVVGWAEFGKQERYRRKTAVFFVRHVHVRCRTWTALHVYRLMLCPLRRFDISTALIVFLPRMANALQQTKLLYLHACGWAKSCCSNPFAAFHPFRPVVPCFVSCPAMPCVRYLDRPDLNLALAWPAAKNTACSTRMWRTFLTPR